MLGLKGRKTAKVVIHTVLESPISTPLQARLVVWFWDLPSKDVFQTCVRFVVRRRDPVPFSDIATGRYVLKKLFDMREVGTWQLPNIRSPRRLENNW